MAKVVIEDLLNKFVKTVAEGGYGIPEAVIGYMTEVRSYTTNELYDDYQNDGDLSADAKALDYSEFKKVIDWMKGKEIDNKTITSNQNLQITYTQNEAFGVENQTGIEGTEATMDAWKPDGTQIRRGIAYPITADTNQFSSLNSITATFTGVAGETYTLLMSCLINGEWKTKEFTIGFAAE